MSAQGTDCPYVAVSNPFCWGENAPPQGQPMFRDAEGLLVCRLAPPKPDSVSSPGATPGPGARHPGPPYGVESLGSTRRAGPRLLAREMPQSSAHAVVVCPGLPCSLLALCGRQQHPRPPGLASSTAWFSSPVGFTTAHPIRTLSGPPAGLMMSLVGAAAGGRGRGSFQHPTPLSPVASHSPFLRAGRWDP